MANKKIGVFSSLAASSILKTVMEDRELLRDYAEHRSEAAFTGLVARYVNLVYSAALRMVGDPHLAKDVAQIVFIGLAQKSHTIRDPGALASWLYRATHNAAIQTIRTENRRRGRETEAMKRSALDDNSPTTWAEISPYLDEAMLQLKPVELQVVMLRYFDGKSLRETGQALALSDDAVQKRVARALEKLRRHFARRGVTASAALVTTLIAANSVQAAPAGLAAGLASAVFTRFGHAQAAGWLAKIFAMTTKTKIIIAAALVLAAATSLTMQHQEISQLRDQMALADKTARAATAQRIKDAKQIKDLGQGHVVQIRNDAHISLTLSGYNGVPSDEDLKPIAAKVEAMVNEHFAQQLKEMGLPGPAAAASGPGDDTFIKVAMDMFNSPAFRASMAADAKKDAEKEYADMIGHFNLSADEHDHFLALLTDRETSLDDVILKLMDPSLTVADRAALRQQQEDLKSASDAKVEEFLNNEGDYAYFKNYMDQKPDLTEVNALNTSLANTAQPLTQAQSDALVNLLYQERTNFKFTVDLKSPSLNLSTISDAEIATHFQEEQQLQNQIAEKAAAILNPEQLTAFKRNQAQALQSDQTGFEVVHQLYRPGAKGPAPPAPRDSK